MSKRLLKHYWLRIFCIRRGPGGVPPRAPTTPVLFFSQTEIFLNREKTGLWCERSLVTRKISDHKTSVFVPNAQQCAAPIEGKTNFFKTVFRVFP